MTSQVRLPLRVITGALLLAGVQDHVTRAYYGRGPIRVVVSRPASERGPRVVPAALRRVVADLVAADARRRLRARELLCELDWRHVSWIEREVESGPWERRLALGYVLRRLRDRRYEGNPPLSANAPRPGRR